TGGLGAILSDRTGRPAGSGRTLIDDQARHIQQPIDDQSPEELAIPAALWTRKAVHDLIRREYGIDVPVRAVGEYLQPWGFTAKVPRRQAKDQDPEEVREGLEATDPAIEERAATPSVAPASTTASTPSPTSRTSSVACRPIPRIGSMNCYPTSGSR